jgi:antitoxin component HigA of HigAB toxin-antitoxin module
MTMKPSRNDEALRRALKGIEKTFQGEAGTRRASERHVLVTLIEADETTHCDCGPADPVEADTVRIEQEGLTSSTHPMKSASSREDTNRSRCANPS